jgi:hypothetical protein
MQKEDAHTGVRKRLLAHPAIPSDTTAPEIDMLTNGQLLRVWVRYIHPETMRRKHIMKIKTQIQTLVDAKELFDISTVCADVFGSGVSCFVTANLFETLKFYSRQVPSDADSAYTAMLREIKADCTAEGFTDDSSIIRFLAQPDSFLCSEILGLPGFYVYACSVTELPALLIGDNEEVLEQIVGIIHASESV